MAIIKETKRSYNGSDTFMLEKCDEFISALTDPAELANFTAFDSTINAAWLAVFTSDTNNALNYDSDELVVSQQMTKTAMVETAMQQCRIAYQDVIYFAEKAFAGNQPVLLEFGQGDKYHTAGKSQSKMTDFMEELFRTATKYTAELTAAGCSAPIIAAIQTAGTNFRNLNTDQNVTVDERPVISQQRILLLNTAFAYIRQVEEAAKRVYRYDFAKQNFYTYNPTGTGAHHSVTVNVTATTPATVAEITYNAARQLAFSNESTASIEIQLSTDGTTASGPWQAISPGSDFTTTQGALAPAGNKVIARLQMPSANPVNNLTLDWDD